MAPEMRRRDRNRSPGHYNRKPVVPYYSDIDPSSGSGPDPHLSGHPPGPVGREAAEGWRRAVALDPGPPEPRFRLRACDPDPLRSARPRPGYPFTSTVAPAVRPPPPPGRGIRPRAPLRIADGGEFFPWFCRYDATGAAGSRRLGGRLPDSLETDLGDRPRRQSLTSGNSSNKIMPYIVTGR
jgi:hypothetical protein